MWWAAVPDGNPVCLLRADASRQASAGAISVDAYDASD